MVLRHPDFLKMWLGQLVSKLGSQFNYVALAWVVLQQTGSGTLTGGVYMAQVLPNALFGWVAGVAVDRGDKRKVMIGCDVLRALLVCLLPLGWVVLGYHHLGLVYAVTFGVSLLSLIFFAGEKSLIPHLVPEEELTEANAYAEMTEQMGALAGPILAGLLVANLSSPLDVLYIDAATFVLSGIALLLLRWRPKQKSAPSVGGWRAVLAEAKEGMDWLLRDRFLKVVFLTAASVNLLVAPFTVVFPVLSKNTLQAGAEGFGWLMGGIGGGMVLGSLVAAWLSARLSAPLIIYGGMALMGVSFAAMGFAQNLPACVLLAAVAGFSLAPSNAIFLTLVQEGTPEEMQGRVFGSLFGLMNITIPLGVAIVSPLLDHVGAPEVLVGIGSLTVIGAFVGRIALGDSMPNRSEKIPG
jgi:DHA3 family macrolide efflux protein-like MFS transporter